MTYRFSCAGYKMWFGVISRWYKYNNHPNHPQVLYHRLSTTVVHRFSWCLMCKKSKEVIGFFLQFDSKNDYNFIKRIKQYTYITAFLVWEYSIKSTRIPKTVFGWASMRNIFHLSPWLLCFFMSNSFFTKFRISGTIIKRNK